MDWTMFWAISAALSIITTLVVVIVAYVRKADAFKLTTQIGALSLRLSEHWAKDEQFEAKTENTINLLQITTTNRLDMIEKKLDGRLDKLIEIITDNSLMLNKNRRKDTDIS